MTRHWNPYLWEPVGWYKKRPLSLSLYAGIHSLSQCFALHRKYGHYTDNIVFEFSDTNNGQKLLPRHHFRTWRCNTLSIISTQQNNRNHIILYGAKNHLARKTDSTIYDFLLNLFVVEYFNGKWKRFMANKRYVPQTDSRIWIHLLFSCFNLSVKSVKINSLLLHHYYINIITYLL